MRNLAFVTDSVESLEKQNSQIDVKPQSAVENDKVCTLEEPKSAAVGNVKVHTFEEAVELCGTGLFHWFLQIVSGTCLTSTGVELMSIGIVMPFVHEDIPATISELGYLTSASYLGVVMSSHAVGFLSDTLGRARVLRVTLALTFITSFITAFSVNIWMLIVLRFLTGFILSSSQACIYSFLGEFHCNKTRARYLTLLSLGMPLAMMILPALAVAILTIKLDWTIFNMPFHSWRLLLLGASSLRLFASIGLHFLPETPKYVLMQGDHDKALKTLQLMFSKNKHKPISEYPVQRISFDIKGSDLKKVSGVKDAARLVWTQTIPLFRKSTILQTLNICFMMFLMCGIGQGSFMWLPTVFNDLGVNSKDGTTLCEIMTSVNVTSGKSEGSSEEPEIDVTMFIGMMAMGAVFVVLYLFCSWSVKFVGKKNLLFAAAIVSAMGCLLAQWAYNLPWAMVAFALMNTLTTGSGILSTIAAEFFPTNICAMGMCLVIMIGRLGAVFASSIYGLLIYSHCNLMFYANLTACLLIAVLTTVLPSTKKVVCNVIELEAN